MQAIEQPLLGIHAARALLSGPEGRLSKAGGPLGSGGWPARAAVSGCMLAVPLRSGEVASGGGDIGAVPFVLGLFINVRLYSLLGVVTTSLRGKSVVSR